MCDISYEFPVKKEDRDQDKKEYGQRVSFLVMKETKDI